MLRRKRKTGAYAVIAIIGTAAAWFIWRGVRPAPLLMQCATLAATAPKGYDLIGAYAWIDSGTMIARLTEQLPPGDMRFPIARIARIQQGSGRVTLLPLKAGSGDCEGFSPDGRWYFWLRYLAFVEPLYLCASDGSAQYKVLSSTESGEVPLWSFAWMGDSRHWQEIPRRSSDPVRIRNLNSPNTTFAKMPVSVDECSVILDSTPAHAILQQPFEGDKEIKQLSVAIWDPSAPARSRRFDVPLPAPGRLFEIAVSPRGDRIAWLVRVHRDAPVMLNRIRRLLRIQKPIPAQERYQLWTTQLDGSSPELIGDKEVTAADDTPDSSMISFIGWTLDAKRVSFTLNNAIWTVPAS